MSTFTCTDCKHGVPQPGEVTVTFTRGNSTVVIKDVPANVCPVCGAWYLSAEMTRKVTEIGNRAISNGAEVEIIRLKAA